jgi:hypothetical protein
MLTGPAALIADFSAAAGELGIDGWPCSPHGELLPAPHRQMALRPGFGAVYAFALSARTPSAAGEGMVLKVGRVGPNSDARFVHSATRYPGGPPWLGACWLTGY